jgi:protein involved in polysaccharide export with SLBB domain
MGENEIEQRQPTAPAIDSRQAQLVREGETTRVFLADGRSAGILLAEISARAGKVIVAPRSNMGDFAEGSDVSQRREPVHAGESEDGLRKTAKGPACRHSADPAASAGAPT